VGWDVLGTSEAGRDTRIKIASAGRKKKKKNWDISNAAKKPREQKNRRRKDSKSETEKKVIANENQRRLETQKIAGNKS